MIGHLENKNSLNYADLPNINPLHYIILEIILVNIIANLIREVSICLFSGINYKIWILGFALCCCRCCYVASVVFDSVRPHGRQPTRLPCPWDSPGKNSREGCHFLLQCVKVKLLSSVWLFVTPWTVAYQAPPSMGLSRQENWSGVPLPSLFGSETTLKYTLLQHQRP